MLGPLLDADRVESDGGDRFLDQFAGIFELNPPIPHPKTRWSSRATDCRG